jgi:hypothetical protein
LGGFLSGVFAPVLTVIFMVPFSVGDRPGNCLFHWVFWELAPVLSVLGNSRSKLPFIQCPPY